MYRYRVECNFGCRYFDNANKAKYYYEKCKAKHLDVEIWSVSYAYHPKLKRYVAVQILLDYTATNLPKY